MTLSFTALAYRKLALFLGSDFDILLFYASTQPQVYIRVKQSYSMALGKIVYLPIRETMFEIGRVIFEVTSYIESYKLYLLIMCFLTYIVPLLGNALEPSSVLQFYWHRK